jgi:hypothetical protein
VAVLPASGQEKLVLSRPLADWALEGVSAQKYIFERKQFQP